MPNTSPTLASNQRNQLVRPIWTFAVHSIGEIYAVLAFADPEEK